MPYGAGTTSVFTSGDIGGGRQYTRIRGPLILGADTKSDLAQATPGASVQAPHIVNASTMPADLILTAGTFFASSTNTAPSGALYLPQSTYSLSSSSGTSSGPTPAPGILRAVALVYDSLTSRICVFSTVVNEWRSVAVSSS